MPVIEGKQVPALEWCEFWHAVDWINQGLEPVEPKYDEIRKLILDEDIKLWPHGVRGAKAKLYMYACDGTVRFRGNPSVCLAKDATDAHNLLRRQGLFVFGEKEIIPPEKFEVAGIKALEDAGDLDCSKYLGENNWTGWQYIDVQVNFTDLKARYPYPAIMDKVRPIISALSLASTQKPKAVASSAAPRREDQRISLTECLVRMATKASVHEQPDGMQVPTPLFDIVNGEENPADAEARLTQYMGRLWLRPDYPHEGRPAFRPGLIITELRRAAQRGGTGRMDDVQRLATEVHQAWFDTKRIIDERDAGTARPYERGFADGLQLPEHLDCVPLMAAIVYGSGGVSTMWRDRMKPGADNVQRLGNFVRMLLQYNYKIAPIDVEAVWMQAVPLVAGIAAENPLIFESAVPAEWRDAADSAIVKMRPVAEWMASRPELAKYLPRSLIQFLPKSPPAPIPPPQTKEEILARWEADLISMGGVPAPLPPLVPTPPTIVQDIFVPTAATAFNVPATTKRQRKKKPDQIKREAVARRAIEMTNSGQAESDYAALNTMEKEIPGTTEGDNKIRHVLNHYVEKMRAGTYQ